MAVIFGEETLSVFGGLEARVGTLTIDFCGASNLTLQAIHTDHERFLTVRARD